MDIGQLFITGISGLKLTTEEKEFLEKENIGGVILFSRNFESPIQLAELVNSIQQVRREYPLFIAVDQEGGRVVRFKEGFTEIPSMADIARLNSPKTCFHLHRIIANELSACGINLNFSPVCDIICTNTNHAIGDRSFGDTPEIVSKFSSSVIRSLQTNNVLACAKHFPGHGSTELDSHELLPRVIRSLPELEKIDLIPFVKAIKSRVEFIMIAHLLVDALDDSYPSSLSSKTYLYLRKKLRYSKIIITDDLEMKALTDNYSQEDIPRLALNAGADILLYRDIATTMHAVRTVKNSIKNKSLVVSEMTEKVEKVAKCKKNNLSTYVPIYLPDVTKKLQMKSAKSFIDDLKAKLAKI